MVKLKTAILGLAALSFRYLELFTLDLRPEPVFRADVVLDEPQQKELPRDSIIRAASLRNSSNASMLMEMALEQLHFGTGPLSLAQLETFDKFEVESISFKCTPPHGVVQSETRRNRFAMPTAPLLDYFANLSMPSLDSSTPQPMDSASSASGNMGGSSQILFGASPSAPLSASPSLAGSVFGDYKFELDLERKQHVDSLELEIELNRDWLPMDDDSSLLAPTYSISVQYLRKVKSSTASVLRESGNLSNPSMTIGSPTTPSTTEYAWLTALDRFDLSSGIIRGGYGPEMIPKLRIGSLALPNVSTKRLQVSLHIAPPSPTLPSLSASLSADVGASGLFSPSPSFSPQSSLVTPPPTSASSTPIPVTFSASGSLSGSQPTFTALNYGRSAKKQSTIKTFAYSHDFDENGLIYWLGTKDATNPGVWKNPAETGDLFLQISHGKMHKPEMKVWDIIGRKGTSATYWGGSTPQWFLIDLGPDQQLMPTVYTLRHGYQHANSFLQNWIFEGSNDCLTWTLLHEGAETPFSSGFESKSFTVKMPEIATHKVSDDKEAQDDSIASSTSKSSLAAEPSNAQTHFRYFRVLQKGNYSMGIGKIGGTPFMCLAGFEVYGELLIHPSATVPLPNVVSSIAFQLSTLKPSHGMSLQQTRLHRRAISESTELHSAILATCCEWRTAPSLRHLCIDMAMDVWRRRVPQTTALVTRMDLRAFLRRNLVKAGKITAQKAARFLLCCLNASKTTDTVSQSTTSTLSAGGVNTGRTGSLPERLSSASRLLPPSVAPSGSLLNISPSSTIVSPSVPTSPHSTLGANLGLKIEKPEPTLKEKLLDALLDMMPDVVDLVDNKHGFNQIMILLVSCWDANPEKAHTSLASAVSLLGTKLNDNRSPFYNLLRTHFGLYGFPLELDIFVPLRELELMEEPLEANLPAITNPLATPHEPALPPQIATPTPTSGLSTPTPSATPTSSLTGATAATANSVNASLPSSGTPAAPILGSTGPLSTQSPSPGDVSTTAQGVLLGPQVPQSLSPTPTTGTHGTITMHATTVMPTTTPAIGPLLAMSETKKLLEQQLLQSTHDFGIKRRALTTLLEEITIAGDSYANHDRSVLAAYDDCISAQMHYHRVFKKLKKLSPTTHDGNFEEEDDFEDDSSDSEADEEDSDDEEDDEDHVKLTRWTFIVESLLSLLNKSSVDIEHTDEDFYDLFSHLVIFGTPLVRKEAIMYLSAHLNTTVPFPATILRNWFSKDTDLSRLMNLFPQQIVFDALQEIMVQDRVRFFYVDGLFSLLEKEISLHQFEMHHYLSNNGNNIPSPGGSSGGPPGAGEMPSSPRNPPSSYAQLFVRSDSSSAKNATHLASSPDGNFGTTDFEIDESAIDVPLVSWLLLLLSNTMHRVSDNAPVHKGSKCRNCNMSPICGVRFRCVNCVDYDLCEACESDATSRHNKLHVFLKIPAALPLPPSSFHGLPPPKEPLLPLLYKKHSMSVLDNTGMPSSSSLNALTLNPGNLASNFGHSTYAHSGLHAPPHGHMPTAPLGTQGLLHSPFSHTDPKNPLVGSGPISSSGTGGGVSTSFFLSIMNQQKSDLQLAGLDSTSISGPHGGYMKATPEVGLAFMGPNFSSSLNSGQGTPIFPHGGAHLSSNVHPLAQAQHMGQPPLLQPKPLYPTGGAPSLIGLTPKSAGNDSKSKGSRGSAGVQEREIHRGVTCDGCGKVNFEGVRFKCVHCDEFNLCDSCEGNVEHYPLHLFLKVRKPLPSRSYHRSHTKGIYNTHDDVDLGKALIPVLLHHAFYPASSYKSHNPPGNVSSPSRIKFSKSVTDMMSFSREEQENQFGLASVPTGTISLRSSLIDLTNDDSAAIGPTPHGGRARAGSLTGPSPASLGRDLSSHPSHDSGSTKVEPDVPGDGEGREQVFDGRHLRSIFGVIMLSARLQTLGPELFLLAMRVLEGLTTQYTPDDIAADVFNHPRFDDFLRQVASYPSLFIRSAVLQMVDKLVNSAAYIVGKEGAHALKRIRTLLRNKAIKLLRESESAPNTASVHSSDNFLLELLLVVTSDKDIIKSESHTGGHDSADFIPSPSSKRRSSKRRSTNRSALSPASAQRAKESRRSKYSSARVPSPSSQGLNTSNSSRSKKSRDPLSTAAAQRSPSSRSPSIDKPLLGDTHASPRTLAPPEGNGGLRERSPSQGGAKKHKKKHSSSKSKSDRHLRKEPSQRDKSSKTSKNGAHQASRKRRESVLQGSSTNLMVPAPNAADDDQYPLDSIANYLVQFLADGDDMPLGSNTAARTWCMVFRLLRFADPQHVGRIPQLTRAIRQAMTAPEELQVLLVDDFVELLSILVSKPGLGTLLQSSILGEISKAFVEAYYEDNTLAFSRVISVMFENFNADVEFDLADVSSLLQVLADSLPESLPAFFPKDDPGNRLIKQLVDYLILIFSSSAMTEQHVAHLIEVAIGQRDKAFSQLVITWLSLIEPKSKQKATAALRRDDVSIKSYTSSTTTSSAMFSGTATPLQPISSASTAPTPATASHDAPVKNASVTIFDLGRSFTRLIKVMCHNSSSDLAAKHFLSLALASLRSKANSVVLAELCLSLIKTEDLAYYFLIELEGFDFFEDQIKNANTKFRSSFLAPAFASMLSATITTKTGPNANFGGLNARTQYSIVAGNRTGSLTANRKFAPSPATPYGKKANKSNLENLSAVAELLYPRGDRQLERLLKESSTQTSAIWMHNYKARSAPSSGTYASNVEDRVTFDMSIPDNVILREIRLDCVANHNGSKFPTYVTIETGTSLSRLLPVGRFSCKQDGSAQSYGSSSAPQTYSSNMKHSATFKFPLPDIEVVKFVRIHIQRPKQSNWIALSRLQLLGHSSLLYNVGSVDALNFGTGDGATPTLVHQLPITNCLDILEHAIGFPRVNYSLAIQKNTTPQFGINLLYTLSKQTFTSIQSIVSNLAQNDPSLSDFLLDQLLEGQTVYHASLAGKVCALADSQTGARLNKLRDFVFQQIDAHSSTSLSSHLVPFLDALSDAISSNIREYNEAKCVVSQSDVKLLFQVSITALDGSLLQQGSLRLLSSLIQSDPFAFDVILEYFSHILKETLETIAQKESEAIMLAVPSAASGVPSIVVSQANISNPASATPSASTQSQDDSAAKKASDSGLPKGPHSGTQLDLPAVNTHNDIFQLFVDKNIQIIISTIGLLASSSPLSALSLLRSGLPERIVQTVKTILTIREEKQQQKQLASVGGASSSTSASGLSGSSIVPNIGGLGASSPNLGSRATDASANDPSSTSKFGSQDPTRPRGEILTLQRILEASLAFLSNMAHENALKSWLGEHAFDLLFDLLKREHGSSLMYAAQQVFRASANLHAQNQSRIAGYVLKQLQTKQDALTTSLNALPPVPKPLEAETKETSVAPKIASPVPLPATSSPLDPKHALNTLPARDFSTPPPSTPAQNAQVVEELLGYSGHSVLSEATVQQLVDMFSIEDKVVLSLHPKNGAEDEVKALGPQTLAPGSLYAPTRQETIKMDKAACNPNLDLEDEGLTVIANSTTTTGWRTVLSTRPITSGVRRWEVVLDRVTSTANVMIGVCEKAHKLNAYLGQNYTGSSSSSTTSGGSHHSHGSSASHHPGGSVNALGGGHKGWSYYGATTGFTYHDGKSDSRYGQKMVQGDVIGVILDLNEGTLSFTRNGEDLGIAFKDIASRELYPAVSLYDAGDRVRFQPLEGAPVDKGPLSKARIEGISPLIYQRSGPLFALHTSVALKEIAESLIGTASTSSNKVVIFEFIVKLSSSSDDTQSVTHSVISFGHGSSSHLGSASHYGPSFGGATPGHHFPSAGPSSVAVHSSHGPLSAPSYASSAPSTAPGPHHLFGGHTEDDDGPSRFLSSAISVATDRSNHGSVMGRAITSPLVAVWDHEETLGSVLSRFGGDCEILDVYFEIVPRAEAAIRQFADTYQPRGDMEDDELDERLDGMPISPSQNMRNSVHDDLLNEHLLYSSDLDNDSHSDIGFKTKSRRNGRRNHDLSVSSASSVDGHEDGSVSGANEHSAIALSSVLFTSSAKMVEKRDEAVVTLHKASTRGSVLHKFSELSGLQVLVKYLGSQIAMLEHLERSLAKLNVPVLLSAAHSDRSGSLGLSQASTSMISGTGAANILPGSHVGAFSSVSGHPVNTNPLATSPHLGAVGHGSVVVGSTGHQVTTSISQANKQAFTGASYSPASDLLKMAGISINPHSVTSVVSGQSGPALVNKQMMSMPKPISPMSQGVVGGMSGTGPVGVNIGVGGAVSAMATPSKKSSSLAAAGSAAQFSALLIKPSYSSSVSLATWKTWLELLELELSVKNFAVLFLHSMECRSLLFKVLSDLQLDMRRRFEYLNTLKAATIPSTVTAPTPSHVSSVPSAIITPYASTTSLQSVPSGGSASNFGPIDPALASTVTPATATTTTSAASSASKVASAATKIGIKTETVPPPADEVLAHPFKPLYRMLITLMQSTQTDVEVALNCREQVYESGILRFVLVDLIAVCDYMPKDPSHPAFKSVVELRKLQSSRMRAESRAKEANKSVSGPAKGTGFGSDAETPLEPFDPSVGTSNNSSWTPEAYLKEQTAISKKVALLLECVHTYLEVVIEDHTSSSNYAQNREKRGLKRPTAARAASGANAASFAGHLPEFDDSDRASTIPDNGSTRGLVGSSATSNSVPISASETSLHAPSRTSSNKSGRVPYHSLSTSHTDDYEDQEDDRSDDDSSSVSSDSSSASGDSDSASVSSKSSSDRGDRSEASSSSDSDESLSSVDSLSSHEFFGTMDDYDADNNESPRRVSQDFRDRKEWRRSFSARRRISRDGSSMRGSTMAYEGSDRNMGSYGMEEERQEAMEEFWDEILDETALIVQPRLSEGAYKLICASNLVSVLESHLRNDTLLDMVPHMEAYESVLRVTNSMLVHEPLLPLIIPTDTTHHIFFLLGKLASMSDHILKRMLQSFLSSSTEEKNLPNSARNHHSSLSHHHHHHGSASSRNHGNHGYPSSAFHSLHHGLSSTPSNTPYSLGSSHRGGGSWLNDEGPLSSSPAYGSSFASNHSMANKHRHMSARIQSSNASRHPRHSSSHPRLNVYTPGGHSVHYNMRPQANLYVTEDGHVYLRGGLEIDNEIRLALELRKTWKFAVFFVETYREKQFSDASAAPGTDGESNVDFSNSSGQAQHVPSAPGSSAELATQEVDESKVYERDSTRYTESMQDHVFAEVDFFDSERGEYRHHYKNMAKTEMSMNPKKVRALVREVTALASSLPLFLESSVFLRIDETRMDVMKCIITGPEGTPYANGVFVFDIFCPPEFPSVPPLVNLQTTGSGTVRFNPNLYNCGKVCLSLLGTWRGGPNEQWNEATTTLLQVFVSIQSLIFVDQPFFNEPGYEALFNTTKGELQSAAYNDTIRLATITWAMVDVLKNLPFGFEQATRLHFALKSRRIMRQTLVWLKDAAVHAHVSPDYFQKLKEVVIELQMLLLQLEPNAMEGLEDPASLHPILPSNIENENDASSSAPSSSSTATATSSTVMETGESTSIQTAPAPVFHEAPIGEDDSYFHPTDIYPHLANKKISAPKE